MVQQGLVQHAGAALGHHSQACCCARRAVLARGRNNKVVAGMAHSLLVSSTREGLAWEAWEMRARALLRPSSLGSPVTSGVHSRWVCARATHLPVSGGRFYAPMVVTGICLCGGCPCRKLTRAHPMIVLLG